MVEVNGDGAGNWRRLPPLSWAGSSGGTPSELRAFPLPQRHAWSPASYVRLFSPVTIPTPSSGFMSGYQVRWNKFEGGRYGRGRASILLRLDKDVSTRVRGVSLIVKRLTELLIALKVTSVAALKHPLVILHYVIPCSLGSTVYPESRLNSRTHLIPLFLCIHPSTPNFWPIPFIPLRKPLPIFAHIRRSRSRSLEKTLRKRIHLPFPILSFLPIIPGIIIGLFFQCLDVSPKFPRRIIGQPVAF